MLEVGLGQAHVASLRVLFSRPPAGAVYPASPPPSRGPHTEARGKEGVPRSPKREVKFLDALALGGLAAAVVAGGGDDGGVAGELLGGREVHAGVEQI